MKIDISEIEHVVNQRDRGSTRVSLRFEDNSMFVHVTVGYLNCGTTKRFRLDDVRAMQITLEELVNSVIENFIDEALKSKRKFNERKFAEC